MDAIGTNTAEGLYFTQTQEVYLESLETSGLFTLSLTQKEILENIASVQNLSQGFAKSLLMIYDPEHHSLQETISSDNCGTFAELNEESNNLINKTNTGLKIFPNPAKDQININLIPMAENASVKIEIYNAQGLSLIHI